MPCERNVASSIPPSDLCWISNPPLCPLSFPAAQWRRKYYRNNSCRRFLQEKLLQRSLTMNTFGTSPHSRRVIYDTHSNMVIRCISAFEQESGFFLFFFSFLSLSLCVSYPAWLESSAWSEHGATQQVNQQNIKGLPRYKKKKGSSLSLIWLIIL